MAQQTAEESLYLSEQRKFRRLEVSIPVWVVEEEVFRRGGVTPWALGYSRDVSLGGSKVTVAGGDEERWQAAKTSGCACLLRFDATDIGAEDYIQGRVRFCARDRETGQYAIGLEYDEGADEAKAAALRSGLKNVQQRRRWKLIASMGVVAAVLMLLAVGVVSKKLEASTAQNAKLQRERKELNRQLTDLSGSGLVSTRAAGINNSFKRQDILDRMKKFSTEKGKAAGEAAMDKEIRDLGLVLSKGASGAAVKLGVALPYGYAWPIVTSDLEQLIGRPLSTVVTFCDFKAPFPARDCRLAQLRGKTIHITWEPWYYSDKNKVKLRDIAAGKYDQYIDRWANDAKVYDSEVFIRWGHEFNGNWYPWCTPAPANGMNAENYKAAFRHIHDRFKRVGAANVRWIWCMNAESVPDVAANDPARAYPGDAYVSVISIDGYNFGGALPNSRWQTFKQIFAKPYAAALKISRDKPIIISEVGCATVGGDKAAWMRDMDRDLRNSFGKIQGVMWFEASKEADWRMASSDETLAAARTIWNQEYYRRGIS